MWKAYIVWDYNWLIVSTKDATTNYLYYVSAPSLFMTNLSWAVVDVRNTSTWYFLEIKQTYDAQSYTWWTEYVIREVYSWSTLPNTNTWILSFITNLQKAYSWTTFTDWLAANILNANTNPATADYNALASISTTIIWNIVVAQAASPSVFPSSCWSWSSITYAQATANKSAIVSSINNYLWCSISDYSGAPATIFGLTNGWTNVLVWKTDANSVPINNYSQYGCQKWPTAQLIWATSLTDGKANTDTLMTYHNTTLTNYYTNPTQCYSSNDWSVAAKKCRDLWAIWYLPAKNELDLMNTNCKTIIWQTNCSWKFWFLSNAYWDITSSTESSSSPYWPISLNLVLSTWSNNLNSKANGYAIRCASSF